MSDTQTDSTIQPETHGFGAEVGRLLDLVVHALYSEREIFLRELVANAADATDRRRFQALTDPALAPPADSKIRIVPDRGDRTLLIADQGLGMTKTELIDHLGTIARSGTRAFGQTLGDAKPEDRPSLIGQFGVGFYSAFMVADRVEVTSRRAGTDEAWTWASDGVGSFTITPATRAEPGTDILLRLKPDADEYLDPMRIETVVRKWADHITIPVTIARDGKDQPANEGTALWRKPRTEITEQGYAEFYRHLGMMFDSPWATLHWHAEGTIEFAALLFIPGMKPFDPVTEDRKSRVRLHVRRMFITDEAELLPSWLRFVVGVVDTEDLPLNVSREMLQTTPVLARIRKAVTSRVISELRNRAKDGADYARFWDNFGSVVKEGLWDDTENRKDIAGLARFHSSAEEGLVSLAEYVGRLKPGQEAIHFLAGDDIDALRASPQLEGFRARGLEVLLLADSIDAFWPDRLTEFEGHPLRSITRGGADLGPSGTDEPKTGSPTFDTLRLATAIRDALAGAVSDVRTTTRLVDSAVVLAANEGGPDLHMQRLMRRSGRSMPTPPPALEINPDHPLIRALGARLEQGGDIAEAAQTLFDLACVQDGELPKDPASFARRITAMLGHGLIPAP